MVLTLSPIGDSLTGTFSFYTYNKAMKKKYRNIEGVYEVAGSVDENGEFFLDAKDWIKRPRGYETVSLKGKINENKMTISGQVEARNCSSFEASL